MKPCCNTANHSASLGHVGILTTEDLGARRAIKGVIVAVLLSHGSESRHLVEKGVEDAVV